MHHGCDVCHNFRPAANLRVRILTRVFFDDHVVILCRAHREIALRAGVTTIDELRELYGESGGHRSYVPRRMSVPHDASPTTDRRQRGRRSTDC
jgi:hypothetical protein